MQPNTVFIQEYSLDAFLVAFQNQVKLGYELNLKDNATYPQQIGFVFTAGMVKPEVKPEVESKVKQPDVVEGTEEQPDSPAPKQRKQKQ